MLRSPKSFIRYRRVTGWALLTAVASLALSGCTVTGDTTASTGSPGSPAPASPAAEMEGPEPKVVATVFENGISVSTAGTDTRALNTGDSIGSGAKLSSTTTGLASLALDGAVARVGAGSDLVVDSIDSAAIHFTVSEGRSWHRVHGEPTAAGYTVTTPFGTIAGTEVTFAVDCGTGDACHVIVFDGTVTVTPPSGEPLPVAVFQQMAMTAAMTDARPVAYPAEMMIADHWVGVNRALDSDLLPAVTPDEAAPSLQEAASLAGTWVMTATITAAPRRGAGPVGAVTQRDWEFGPITCTDGCEVPLTRTLGVDSGVQTIQQIVPYDGGQFQVDYEVLGGCYDLDDGTLVMAGAYNIFSSYNLVVSATEVRNGVLTATALAGDFTSHLELRPEAEGTTCEDDRSVAEATASAVLVKSTAAAPVIAAPVPLPPVVVDPVVEPAPAAPGDEPGIGTGDQATREPLGSSPDAPSVLSSLRTVQQVNLAPWAVAGSIGLVLILMLIVGYPAQLLNSTISTHYDRIMGWTAPFTRRWARLRPPAPPADAGAVDGDEAVTRPGVPHWLAVTLGIIAASVIAAFIDPGFGFNAGSARLFVSLAVSFVVRSLFAWLLVLWVVKRLGLAPKPTVRFRYASLLIVVAAVVFSRLTAFEPGIVFGAVFGLALGLTLAKAHDARLTLVGLGYAAGVSVACWLAYSWLVPVMGPQPGFVGRFFLETLSGFTVGGFSSLPLSLLPMAILSGGKLFAWRKPVWAACYGVGLLVFILVLMPLPTSWGTVDTPFTLWLSLYIGFGVFAVLFWAYFRLSTLSPATSGPVTAASSRTAARPEESDEITVDADQ